MVLRRKKWSYSKVNTYQVWGIIWTLKFHTPDLKKVKSLYETLSNIS